MYADSEASIVCTEPTSSLKDRATACYSYCWLWGAGDAGVNHALNLDSVPHCCSIVDYLAKRPQEQLSCRFAFQITTVAACAAMECRLNLGVSILDRDFSIPASRTVSRLARSNANSCPSGKLEMQCLFGITQCASERANRHCSAG